MGLVKKIDRTTLKEGDYIHSTFGAEFIVLVRLGEITARCTKGGYTELSEKYINVGAIIIPDLICSSWNNGKHPETLENEIIVLKNEIKKLQHFKDATIGLWAMDKDPKETTKEWIDKNAFQIKEF